MQKKSTFISNNWDFSSIWGRPIAGGYMVLQWEGYTLDNSSIFDAGDGTVGTPYEIATAEQLNSIGAHATYTTKNFILTANLDMTGITVNPIGQAGGAFTGNFDGDSFSISNITINQPTRNFQGLFDI